MSGQMWWHMPIVAATQEAEVGRLLEPGTTGMHYHAQLIFFLTRLVSNS